MGKIKEAEHNRYEIEYYILKVLYENPNGEEETSEIYRKVAKGYLKEWFERTYGDKVYSRGERQDYTSIRFALQRIKKFREIEKIRLGLWRITEDGRNRYEESKQAREA